MKLFKGLAVYFWFYFVMGMLVGGFAVGLVNFLISRILKGRKERFRHHIDSIASANQIARFPTSSNFYMVQETLLIRVESTRHSTPRS